MIKALYVGDNGRLTCADLKCAGMTAFYSKMRHDLNGFKMERVTPEWAHGFEAATNGAWPKCEGCNSDASVL
jgi:hypothetical protein